MGSIRFLKCRECGAEYTPVFKYICEECFGPLDVIYDVPTGLNKAHILVKAGQNILALFRALANC